MDRQHGQAIVKSLSKGLGLDEVGYIPVPGRHDADIDRDRLSAPTTLISPSCNTPKSLAGNGGDVSAIESRNNLSGSVIR